MQGFQLQGENVRISLKTSTASTTSEAVGLFDSQGNVRPLAAWEKLSIDSITCDVPGTIVVDLLNAPASTSTEASSTILLSFSASTGEFHTDKEGMDCSTGVIPSLLASGSGTVRIQGVGRILNGKTQPGRPNWRENLTAGFAIQP